MSHASTKKPRDATASACERRREEILDAATRLFAEHGFTDAVTQLLADELGIGKGTIYRHFSSKKDLFLAAADRAVRQLHDRMEASKQGVEDPLERVVCAVGAYLDFFTENPECVELLVQERAYFKDRAQPTYLEHREKYVERWRDLYRSLMAEGRVREMPAERISDVLTAAIFGSMVLNYFGGRAGAISAGADDILDVILYGILSEPERRRRLNPARPGGEPGPSPAECGRS